MKKRTCRIAYIELQHTWSNPELYIISKLQSAGFPIKLNRLTNLTDLKWGEDVEFEGQIDVHHNTNDCVYVWTKELQDD